MNRNKQLRMWGTCLRGHATGGLQYGVCDEPDTARYNRMMEIAEELLDKTDDIDEESVFDARQALFQFFGNNIFNKLAHSIGIR